MGISSSQLTMSYFSEALVETTNQQQIYLEQSISIPYSNFYKNIPVYDGILIYIYLHPIYISPVFQFLFYIFLIKWDPTLSWKIYPQIFFNISPVFQYICPSHYYIRWFINPTKTSSLYLPQTIGLMGVICTNLAMLVYQRVSIPYSNFYPLAWQIGVGRFVSIKTKLFSGSMLIYQRVYPIMGSCRSPKITKHPSSPQAEESSNPRTTGMLTVSGMDCRGGGQSL